jgi:hypothetical protein
MNAKMFKVLSHQWVNADVSIWMDGRLTLRVPAEKLVDDLLEDNDMVLFSHALTNRLSGEVELIREYRASQMGYVVEQCEHYLRSGLPDECNMLSGSFLVRRHTESVKRFNSIWWSEICRWSERDQMALPYAVRSVPELKLRVVPYGFVTDYFNFGIDHYQGASKSGCKENRSHPDSIDWKSFDTDKATVRGHSYDRVYPVLFNRLPDISTIMEIGVQRGGSLLLWKTIFPDWKVVGVDVCDKPVSLSESKAIEFVKANAYCDETLKALERFKGQCSVVIDDGSHQTEHLCFFAKNYPTLLMDGGILIVEDIQSPEIFVKVQACLPEPLRSRSFMVDARMFKKRHDDIMLIAYK